MNNIYQITGHLHINSLENLLQLHVSIQNQYLDKYFIPLKLSFFLLKCSYFFSMFFPMQFLIVIHLNSSFELKPLPLLYLFYTIYLAITYINLA